MITFTVLELVNRKVSAVVGPFRSSHAQIASYILSELSIPMITPTSTGRVTSHSNLTPFV